MEMKTKKDTILHGKFRVPRNLNGETPWSVQRNGRAVLSTLSPAADALVPETQNR